MLYALFSVPPALAATIGKPKNFLNLNSGLVGWWTFDGKDVPNGRANDVSGNGNHGSLTNIATSTFYTVGKIGQGFRFDGVDDYVATPYTIIGASPFTNSGWFKATSFGATGNVSNPVVSERRGDTTKSIAMGADAGKFAIEMYAPSQILITGSTLTTGKWYYGVYTYDGTSVRGYLNGVLDISPNTLTYAGINNQVTIGKGLVTSPVYFNGLIDDVRPIANRSTDCYGVNIYSPR